MSAVIAMPVPLRMRWIARLPDDVFEAGRSLGAAFYLNAMFTYGFAHRDALTIASRQSGIHERFIERIIQIQSVRIDV